MNNDFYYMLVTPTPPFNIFIENCNFIRKKKSDPVPYFGLINIGRIRMENEVITTLLEQFQYMIEQS
jgi:hypothetical protein